MHLKSNLISFFKNFLSYKNIGIGIQGPDLEY
jgi:hypothetical protein